MQRNAVFDRTGRDEMSRSSFYFVLGAVLTIGFAVSAYVSTLTASWQPNLWVFLGVGLLVPLVGIFLSAKSDNPMVSFIGFLMVVGPLGAILGPLLASYKVSNPGLVTEALLFTGGVTAVMMVSGLLFPNFYSKIGGALLMALLCFVGVSIAGLFIPALGQMTWIHYIGVGLFALYIGFDMYRASTIPATVDNAIDVAVALYLDIVNLFLQYAAARR